MVRKPLWLISAVAVAVTAFAAVPVELEPVLARQGIVVAGHPAAAEIGLAVLKAGGNAIDAAVATSLAVGVAEPYGSGLGGKLMLLYYEAKSGKTYVVDAMDSTGSINTDKYVQRSEDDHTYGYGSVCVPGLGAGLWAAHQRWGARKWPDVVRPASQLARKGVTILPKTRDLYDEQEKKLRRGDTEIARLYLPNGQLPEIGSVRPNEDLARTLDLFAEKGRDGFYRGTIADAIIAAVEAGGGVFTQEDLAGYEARVTETIGTDFREFRLESAPPPASGAMLFLPILKALENETFTGGLRTAENLDKVGRVWRVVAQEMWQIVGDVPESRFLCEKLLAPDSIAAIRAQAFPLEAAQPKVAWGTDAPFYESEIAATTHFVIVDREGNVVTATQSLSLHFGAGVVPPGTGVVLNNSMSNFSFSDPKSVNSIAAHKRSRSTIAPTLVFRGGKPVLAIGLPGASRIPTALLQVLLDRLALDRPMAEAIGDTRVHYVSPFRRGEVETFEAERSFPAAVASGLQQRGWKVVLTEAAGRGRYFGGVNAVEINRDGTMTGYADPRRTNSAAGY
jgi:gamma-glutamyltranspeptidase / glutathione hydrolase